MTSFLTSLFNLGRDVEFIRMLSKTKTFGEKQAKEQQTIADVLEHRVKLTPDAEAICFEGKSWSFAELDTESNRVAHWGLSVGLEKANTIALVMENSPSFLFVVFGMAKIGVTVALINHNLVGKPLAFSMAQTGCRLVVFDHSTTDRLREFANPDALPLFCYSADAATAPSFATQLDPSAHADTAVDKRVRSDVVVTDTAFHIFTSGTTGMPKAARINHLRATIGGFAMMTCNRVKPSDRVYVTLPLYHSSAMLIGVFGCMALGIPMLLRRKFSARSFFSDCAAMDATVCLYIGELLRFLVATPPGEHDTTHRVRLAIGNGLRPDIWAKFQQRFGVAEIGEFYASTEGNANLINNQNRVGAMGFISPLIAFKYPVKIVKFDVESETVLRNETGRCIEVKPGEAGELIGLINNEDLLRRFDGYTDTAATEKKILHDVLKPGDKYFRTGDLVRQDAEGFVYFVDRIGDTYRWKGENVSTAEVGEVLSGAPGVTQATVYGVSVPHVEGRAGMASIVVGDDDAFTLEALYARCAADLPKYAQPLFVRRQPELEITGTFKNRKVTLVDEGFDPARVAGDALFMRDDAKKSFLPLDGALYGRIMNGELKM